MGLGIALLLLGGFLLGGVWSVWNAPSETGGRTTAQLFFAVFLLVAAGLASVAGILWMVGD